ncbi:hypothetical protein ACIBBD_02170 [Streptomyces sp. NPDC051315]|uniref:hypothetical protein n=1 Tax=Streptomyces sp. NPDC051315 TaxID=3365650 RepID=UPI0037B1EBB3
MTALHAAITAALADHGINHPAAVEAAVQAAVAVLGRDRCTHDRNIHTQHHRTPVHGCPWCTDTSPADRTASKETR